MAKIILVLQATSYGAYLNPTPQHVRCQAWPIQLDSRILDNEARSVDTPLRTLHIELGKTWNQTVDKLDSMDIRKRRQNTLDWRRTTKKRFYMSCK